MFNPDLKVEKFSVPFDWINITNLFSPKDSMSLSQTYPRDNYRTISTNSQDRQYNYDVRNLINFKNNVGNKDLLSESWAKLSEYLTSSDYRDFIQKTTGINVSNLPVEVNVYKYSKDCFMDAHQDLNIKVLTQVIYFNDEWDEANGGCLNILNSKNIQDVYKKVLPTIGNSVVIIRSEKSWHSVETTLCDKSRRSVTITFYKKGSNSPMWIAGTKYQFHENSV